MSTQTQFAVICVEVVLFKDRVADEGGEDIKLIRFVCLFDRDF